MEVSVHIVRFDWPGGAAAIPSTLTQMARAADDAGVHAISVMDHFFQLAHRPPIDQPMLEGYTTMSFLAAHTSRVRLGLLVGGVTYRYPGLLAKTVANLDLLSGGRARFGIGAAWYEREHLGLGVPFPPVAERFERLEETLQICLQMWGSDDGPYAGRHYQLAETICSPKPVSAPHPQILVGGSGERKTLRLVARYADACNLSASLGPDDLAHKIEVLHAHCDDVGRDRADVKLTVGYIGEAATNQDVDAFVADMEVLGRLGIQEVMVIAPGTDEPVAWVEKFVGAAVPRVADC